VLSVPFGAWTLKYYAFQSGGPYLPQALRSYVIYLPAQLLSSALLLLFARLFTSWSALSLSPLAVGERTVDPIILIAQLCTIFFATIVSYIGHKYFTFRPQSSKSERHTA